MTRAQFSYQVASITGEPRRTVRALGFGLLTEVEHELEREALAIEPVKEA
jgi:hypothetical protein